MRGFLFPFGHDSRQCPPKCSQRDDARVQLPQMFPAHFADTLAGSAALFPQVKNLFDLRQRKAEPLRLFSELNPAQGLRRIEG